MTNTENRGGKRLNAGRKKTTEDRTNIDIYLSDFNKISELSKELKVSKIKALQIVIESYFELLLDKSNK